jgi:ribosomal protein L7Ae-like RNA K-turn-binding protein
LALDDLKKKSISVHLQVYDIGSKANQLESVLQKAELQTVHLLIGGSSDEQIRLISAFSNNHGIPYVIPFTAKSNEPLTNHNIYQINTPQSYLYSKTSLEFYNKFNQSNIIFFNTGKKSNKSELIDMIKDDLDAKKIPYKTVGSASALVSELNTSKNNVFVPSDDSKETLAKLIASLKASKTDNPDVSISLFGYPSWQMYSTEYAADFFRLDVHFYTIFYANPTSPAVKSFYNKYNHWYSRELINKYPRYGILGYDTGMYFVQLFNRYGTSFAANINQLKYEGVQTDFHFEPVSNWGGFINTNIYFIEFSPVNNKIHTKRFY